MGQHRMCLGNVHAGSESGGLSLNSRGDSGLPWARMVGGLVSDEESVSSDKKIGWSRAKLVASSDGS